MIIIGIEQAYLKMKRLFNVYLAASALLCVTCTSDVEDAAIFDAELTLQTALLHFEGDILRYEPRTRSTTSAWDEGACLYIQYRTANGLVDGIATYHQDMDEWMVNYHGSITNGQLTQCEVYYFEQFTVATMTSVTFSQQSAVYADTLAMYRYENGKVTLKAHLRPLTGRIRFRGAPGKMVSFTGLKWYNSYNITTNTFTTEKEKLTLTVDTDGYTPYVYASFADPVTRKLSIDSEDVDFSYEKNFDATVLTAGESGFINIPSMESRNGWQLVDVSKRVFSVNGVSFTMVRVKAGTFQMGNLSSSSLDGPMHSVTLTNDFYIGETEVTNALYKAVKGYSPSSQNWGDNYPVEGVSWNNLMETNSFLELLNRALNSQLDGKQFRLPTEAEWEFAARGGHKQSMPNYTYAGSNNIDEVAWYTNNSNNRYHPVAQKKANELGIYDMSGNLWEWCQDWYDSNYYSVSPVTNPTGPTTGSYRIIRGGAYQTDSFWTYCVTSRWMDAPSTMSLLIGFRLAL